jgi:hypothetical protein
LQELAKQQSKRSNLMGFKKSVLYAKKLLLPINCLILQPFLRDVLFHNYLYQ